MSQANSTLPVIDVSALANGAGNPQQAVDQLGQACRESGFFYIRGHGIDADLQLRLESLSRQFFALPQQQKLELRMALGGRAWRGYFPVGGELTSGLPDQKEGLYFGAELSRDHPAVRAGLPLHGPNLFPQIAGFRETVLEYQQALTELGHLIMSGIARSLGLAGTYFQERLTEEPTILFRIFHYPPLPIGGEQPLWSVGEHTDYGLLTILLQDDSGGLEVKSQGRWIEAQPIEGTFVCNLGDMLDRMTGGLYRSTAHRVRNLSARGRLSFPFFFDPSWDARVEPIRSRNLRDDNSNRRWDRQDLTEINGTYGEYLTAKVARVFPELMRDTLS